MMIIGKALRVPIRICWYHTLFAQTSTDVSMPRWKLNALKLRKQLVYRTATHLVANSEAGAIDVQLHFGVAA